MNNKLLVLDIFLKQMEDIKDIPKDIAVHIIKEFDALHQAELEGKASLNSYLISNNGKSFKGAEHIYKFRLSSGDRILYTYGKYLKCIRDNEKESIVLIGFSHHDNQGFMAKNFNFTKDYAVTSLEKIVEEIIGFGYQPDVCDTISEEDFYAIIQLLASDDYMAHHSIYVLSETELISGDLNQLEVYISEEQKTILDDFSAKPLPTLILGGAGTGKTLLAIHALDYFAKNQPLEKLGVYFTQSKALINNTKRLYDKLTPEEEHDVRTEVEFFDINEFCMEQLGYKPQNFVKTKQFLDFADFNFRVRSLLKENGITPIEVWTEIRGTLKGRMPDNWQRTTYLDQNDIGNITKLIKSGYCVRKPDDKQKFILSDSVEVIEERAQNDHSLSGKDREILNKIIKYYSGYDKEMRTLSKEDYYSLREDNATLDGHQRSIVWEICEIYEAWLKKNQFYDDNDLAREMTAFALCGKCNIGYDMVAVDEVQDYTETQLYLLSKICKSSWLLFLGDIHQNVRPTFFDYNRLNALLQKESSEILPKPKVLERNYRCTQNIVDAANNIAALRRKVIASTDVITEQPAKSEREGPNLLRLESSERNLSEILAALIQYPKTAVLVSNDRSKQLLEQYVPEREKQKIENIAFTPEEIKGMEFEYIVCYNLIGDYIQIWNAIFNGEARHQRKFRYYFNLLYVAITRSQKYLCFMDSKSCAILEEAIKTTLIKNFDYDSLHINELSSLLEDWFQQAEEFEKNGMYKQALNIYREHGGAPEAQYRCLAFINEEDNKFDEALRFSLLSQNQDLIQMHMKNALSDKLRYLANVYLEPTIKKHMTVENIVNELFVDTEENKHIHEVFLERFIQSIKQQNEDLRNIVS